MNTSIVIGIIRIHKGTGPLDTSQHLSRTQWTDPLGTRQTADLIKSSVICVLCYAEIYVTPEINLSCVVQNSSKEIGNMEKWSSEGGIIKWNIREIRRGVQQEWDVYFMSICWWEPGIIYHGILWSLYGRRGLRAYNVEWEL